MKHSLLFSSALCLVLGLLCGILIPISWDAPDPVSAPLPPTITSTLSENGLQAQKQEKLDPRDNFSLLNAACLSISAIKEHNYPCLGSLVHPERGVTFTPFSTVRPETDVTLSASQISKLESSKTVYVWGEQCGSGSLIEMTPKKYFERFVFDRDYTLAPRMGVDQILMDGNALENLKDSYPDCRFVDFTFPCQGSVEEGMNWSSLKLVFAPGEYQWYLVAMIHGQWTT